MEMVSGHKGIPHCNREAFAVDFDERTIIYDEWLISNKFKYVDTLMSSSGGIRQYKNDSVVIGVFRFSHDDKGELRFYIDNIVNNKPVSNGVGFELMKLKLSKIMDTYKYL